MKLSNIRPLLVLALIAGLFAGTAAAQGNHDISLYVTPVYNLSVNISSTTNSFGDGPLTLGESRTICVGTIANDGNVPARWQKRSGNSSGESEDWTLVTSGAPGIDQFRLLAVTTHTALKPDFTNGFTGLNDNTLIDGDHTSENRLGVRDTWDWLTEGGSSSPAHEPFETEYSTRSLWMSIMMPSQITTGQAQSITLSIKAVLP